MNNSQTIKSPSLKTWSEAVKTVIKKKGVFRISQDTLDEFRYGRRTKGIVFAPEQIAFESFLETEHLVLVKINDRMSLIKNATQSDRKPTLTL